MFQNNAEFRIKLRSKSFNVSFQQKFSVKKVVLLEQKNKKTIFSVMLMLIRQTDILVSQSRQHINSFFIASNCG